MSIIIPVYKVEKYLSACLDSILQQIDNSIEIILVDDGSPDNSGMICDFYSRNYTNISVIHKENGGLSDARNAGIDKSKGRYIWFIDSDDDICENSIQQVVSKIKEYTPDVFVIQSKIVHEDGYRVNEKVYTIKTGLYSSQEYMEQLKNNSKSVIFCAQYQICKKEFIEKNSLRFYKGIIHEDELWTPQILLCASSIYYSGLNIYNHYMRPGSIMNSNNYEKSGRSDLIVTRELSKLYDEAERTDLQYLRDHMADIFMQAVWKVPDFFSNKKNIQRSFPLKNAFYKKTKLKAILYYISPKLYLIIHNNYRRKNRNENTFNR